MVRFYKGYFFWAALLFIIELCIGLFVHDSIIRPFGGDFLVVILIYCVLKSFFNLPIIPAVLGVLLFAYAVEISQYFHLVNLLGLQNSRVAKILLGTTFSLIDLLTYTLGAAFIIIVENFKVSLAKS